MVWFCIEIDYGNCQVWKNINTKHFLSNPPVAMDVCNLRPKNKADSLHSKRKKYLVKLVFLADVEQLVSWGMQSPTECFKSRHNFFSPSLIAKLKTWCVWRGECYHAHNTQVIVSTGFSLFHHALTGALKSSLFSLFLQWLWIETCSNSHFLWTISCK